MDFTLDELRSGATNCRDILASGDIGSRLRPWPNELKTFLIEELRQFKAAPLLAFSLHGIYLVDSEVMTNPETGTAAGIACDRGKDLKGLVFLNFDSFVRDRGKGPGIWQDLHVVTNKYVIQDAGDNAAATLIHELIHTIDNKLFVHGDPSSQKLRSDIFNMAWESFSVPRSRRISIFFLDSTTNPIESLSQSVKTGGWRCRREGFDSRSRVGAQLTADSQLVKPEELAGDLQYIAEQTNFLVPYAMATAAEDFAETMTVYHFGLRRDSWQVRTVYDRVVTPRTRDSGMVLYRHDTESLVKNSANHKDKICAMAELLFGRCDL